MRSGSVVCLFALTASVSSHAQSSLTLYGVLDANVGLVTNTVGGTRVQELSSAFSPDGIGIRGTEDLGGGVKAIFRLESSLLLQNGALFSPGVLWGALSYVGLQSNTYGSVTLGRQYSPMTNIMVFFTPGLYSNQYNPAYTATGSSFYENNSIKYTFRRSGLETEVLYSLGGVAGSLYKNSAFGAGVTYNFGSIAAAITYDQANTASSFDYTPDRRIAVALSASLGSGKIMAGYRYGDGELNFVPQYEVYHRDHLIWFGGNYYITPADSLMTECWVDLIESYGVNSAERTPLPTAQQLDFQYRHFLSKRTDVYLVGAYARKAAIDFDSLYSGDPSALAPGRPDQLGFGVGVSHRF